MARHSTPSSPKVSRPRLHRVVARQRLFDRIASSRSAVLWITGPPGAGKTTLAASLIESTRLRAVWYQVDADDADAASLFYFMRQGAVGAGAAQRIQAPLAAFGRHGRPRGILAELFPRAVRHAAPSCHRRPR